MPFSEKRLTNPTTLSTVASTVYTVPSQFTTIMKQLVVTNTTASAASFNLYIGSATAANAVFSNTTVSANDSLIINLSQVLSSLEVLTASANANSALNMTISGVENNGPLDPASVYIANSAITTSKIADSAVTTVKLADNSVTTAKIAAGAVVTADLADNAVTQAKLDTAIPLSGFRNAIINGSFDVWQRGNSATFTPTINVPRYDTADRWAIVQTSPVASITTGRVAADTPFLNYGFQWGRTNGATATTAISLVYNMESLDARKFAGKQVTLSFYLKRGAGTSPTSVSLSAFTATGTDQTTQTWFTAGLTGQSKVLDTVISPTTTITRYQYTFTCGSTTNQIVLQFFYNPSGTASNEIIQLEGVQLEVGSQATPFEQRPYGIELELCQRYYYLHVSGYNKAICHGHYYSANGFEGFLSLPTRMRTTPTLDYVQGTNYYNIYSTGNDLSNYVFLDGYATDTMVALYDNASAAGTAGYGGMYLTYNAASYVAFKAEL